jgi:hypothetical protein
MKWVKHGSDQMIIKITKAERDTILAALRRWQSYPAAREADSIATNGGKHKPLDNAEIEGVCKRLAKIERKRDAARLPRQSNNGARERRPSKNARPYADGSKGRALIGDSSHHLATPTV